MKTLIAAALICLAASGAQAQTTAADQFTYTRKEPRSMFIAVVGVTVAAAGIAVIEQRDPCCCFPQPTPHQIAGGVSLVGIGAGLIVYGTQLRWVTRVIPSPSISRGRVAAVWRVR